MYPSDHGMQLVIIAVVIAISALALAFFCAIDLDFLGASARGLSIVPTP